MTTVYVYVMETMADWELGYVMAELHSKRYFRKDAPEIEVRTVGDTKDAVQSMGGLTILPDYTIDEIKTKPSNLLILPGSNTWNDPKHEGILNKAEEFLKAGAGVAAICGVTVALAERGLLDERQHTSNGVGFLDRMCPQYKGQKSYVDELSVVSDNLITAGSTGGLLMAKQILNYLHVFRSETLKAWYEYFSTGKAEHFFELMQTIQ